MYKVYYLTPDPVDAAGEAGKEKDTDEIPVLEDLDEFNEDDYKDIDDPDFDPSKAFKGLTETEPEKKTSTKKEIDLDDDGDDDPDDNKIDLEKDEEEIALEQEEPEKPDEKEEEVSSWMSMAKDLEIEGVDTDDFDLFKSKYQEKLKNIETETEKKIRESIKIDVDKYGEKAKQFITALEAGQDIDSLVNPGKAFDDLITLDDIALVTKEYEAKKWEKDMIKQQLEVLKEEGKLELAAYEVRKRLSVAKEDYVSDYYKNLKAENDAKKTSKADEIKAENDIIFAAIDKMDTFEGLKITEKTKQTLKSRWAKGIYKEKFAKEADTVVKLITEMELRPLVDPTIKKKMVDQGKKEKSREIQGRLHNLEDLKKTGDKSSGKGVIQDTSEEDGDLAGFRAIGKVKLDGLDHSNE